MTFGTDSKTNLKKFRFFALKYLGKSKKKKDLRGCYRLIQFSASLKRAGLAEKIVGKERENL